MNENEQKNRHWFGELMTVARRAYFLHFVFVLLLVAVLHSLFAPGHPKRQHVIVYTSQDQIYAEPILKEFEQQTGIKVRAVYDSEAVKTVGLANRLLAERDRPQCDVFWNNEALRTHQLDATGVFRETNGIAEIGYRSRRMVVNTNKLSLAEAPRALTELTNAAWRGKVAFAYPLFGTTATHFLVLRRHWGDERWEAWCRALQANRPFLVDGNSVVAKLVGKGEAWIGLTDSDDIAAEQRNGAPVAALPLSEDSLLIPNTVGVIRGARNPEAAQKLFDYLQKPQVVKKLVSVNALEGVSIQTADVATLKRDWVGLSGDLAAATTRLKEIFLR